MPAFNLPGDARSAATMSSRLRYGESARTTAKVSRPITGVIGAKSVAKSDAYAFDIAGSSITLDDAKTSV